MGVRLGLTAFELSAAKEMVSKVLKLKAFHGFRVVDQRRNVMDEVIFQNCVSSTRFETSGQRTTGEDGQGLGLLG